MFTRHLVVMSLVAAGWCEQPQDRAKLNSDAWHARISDELQEAERLYNAAIAAAENAGTHDETYLESLRGLATVFSLRANYARAETLLARVFSLSEALHGAESREAETSRYQLVWELKHQCKFDSAELLLKNAAETKLRRSKQSYDTAESLYALAENKVCRGSYAEAEQLYEQARDILESPPYEQYPQHLLACVLTGLGELYNAQGKGYDAEPLIRRSVKIVTDDPLQGIFLQSVRHRESCAVACYLQGKPLESKLELDAALECRRYAYGIVEREVARQRDGEKSIRSSDY